MSPWRIILAATAFETSTGAAVLALLALCGAWSPWLDALTHFAPMILMLGLLAVGLGLIALRGRSRRVVLGLAALGVAVPTALMAPDLAARTWQGLHPAPAGKAPLKVLTFNTWTENFAPEQTLDVILKSGADVVALQEDEALILQNDRINAVYPYRAECDPPWACGSVILSKRPITAKGHVQRSELLRRHDFEAVWATTPAPDGQPVTVMTTHFAWPIPPEAQAGQRRGLIEHTRALADPNLIVTGDLNSTPWSFAMRGVDAGMAPLTRRTRALFSWPANVARLNRPFPAPLAPIDHIFAAPIWRTVSIGRLERAGSDHYGVLAVFSRAPVSRP
ncbi:MAG: endonuclease/exonuclease/phosphatase family protein [Caulobacteraceae bacterium]